MVLLSGLDRRQDEILHAQQTTLRLAESYAQQQETETLRIQKILANLAQEPEVQNLDIPACTVLFRHALRATPTS